MARRPRPIEIRNVTGIRSLVNQSLGLANDRLAAIQAMNYANRDVITNLEATIAGLQTTLDYVDGLIQAVSRDPSLT